MSNQHCSCKREKHEIKRIVLTGGPGAGKTAVLETLKKEFCKHVVILPESASVIFGGGFWRHTSVAGKKAAQRAIFHVQKELETIAEDEQKAVIALCDRGSLDGLAYWPVDEALFFEELGTSREKELARYSAVIHLRVPEGTNGYNNTSNPLRIENEMQAKQIDERIISAWEGHPRRFFIDSSEDFLDKITRAGELLNNEIPECCRMGKK